MKTKLTLTLCLLLLASTVGCQSVVSLKPMTLPPPTPLPPPTLSPDSRLVALYFDDAFHNQYEEALPVLLKYGFRATFVVITGSIGEGHDLMKYMDKKELKELAQYGMEIASHTRSHSHLTGELSDRQLRREIFDSKQDLEKMGFAVSTMVYPYYEYNDKVIEYTREAGYVCARAGWTMEGAYDLTTSDPLARYHVSATQISNQDLASFKLIVDKASRNSVVCLVYHILSYTGPEVTSTTVADFYAQMSYLHKNGYTVVLLPELLKP
jgi:peptidoglycan/xylan/chitin deacetylase (PgdA/CDA1 family)